MASFRIECPSVKNWILFPVNLFSKRKAIRKKKNLFYCSSVKSVARPFFFDMANSVVGFFSFPFPWFGEPLGPFRFLSFDGNVVDVYVDSRLGRFEGDRIGQDPLDIVLIRQLFRRLH
jgi:hypothetical protein